MGHFTILFIDLTGISFDFSDIVALVVVAVATTAGVVKGVSDIWRYGWKPSSKRFWDWIRRRRTRKKMWVEYGEQMTTFSGTLERIEAQLRTNGGGSLKDIVMSIDEKVDHHGAWLRHLDETNPVPIFELDVNGGLRFTNASFRDLLDAEDGDLHHKNYVARAHPGDRRRLEDEIRQSIENKMPIDSTCRFIIGTDYLKIRLQAMPNVRPDGTLLGYFGRAVRILET